MSLNEVDFSTSTEIAQPPSCSTLGCRCGILDAVGIRATLASLPNIFKRYLIHVQIR